MRRGRENGGPYSAGVQARPPLRALAGSDSGTSPSSMWGYLPAGGGLLEPTGDETVFDTKCVLHVSLFRVSFKADKN